MATSFNFMEGDVENNYLLPMMDRVRAQLFK